jgi:predicted DNA-binding transcriptional regulator YafY
MATITQFEILKILSRRKQGTRQIRDALASAGIELTLRSVQRNLEKLSESFPITSDHQNPAGWKWAEDCEQFDLLGMDANAALTLRLAEQHLTPMMPKSCLDTLRPYMQRARNLLDEVTDGGVGEWHNRVARLSRTQHLIPPKIDAAVLEDVFRAVLKNRQLSIMYRRIGGNEAQERIVNPLGVVFVDGSIYLVGTAWDYADIRQFAMHRMESVQVMETKCPRKESFDLKKYIDEGNFDFPLDGALIDLQLMVDDWLAEYLEENRLSEDQIIVKEGENYLVEASVRNTLQLKWWILGLGSRVEVLAPINLRTAMRVDIQNLHEMYRDRNNDNGGNGNA